jgi:acetoin utilization deacetylase AcuC-like enzyme
VTTALIWDEHFFWFDAGGSMPPLPGCEPYPAFDRPDTKRRIKSLLDASGLIDHLTVIQPVSATRDDLLRFHSEDYVARVEALSNASGGDTGENAWIGARDFATALLSVGGCMTAVDAVLAGEVNNAYALVRPCGHHSTRDRGMGFAIFCNIALAIMRAREAGTVDRVAVIDWDVHHGNGTQDAFYDDAKTLTVSIHQDNCYPKGTGTMEERGEGPGLGYNINLPLPPGSGHGAYLAAFDRVVVPALERFAPDLIVVASGLDANGLDPLARMMCYGDTYREMTARLMAVADAACGGKLVICHEGGYSPQFVPFAALAVLEQLSQRATDVVDPWSGFIEANAGQELQPHQAAVIDVAAVFLDDL